MKNTYFSPEERFMKCVLENEAVSGLYEKIGEYVEKEIGAEKESYLELPEKKIRLALEKRGDRMRAQGIISEISEAEKVSERGEEGFFTGDYHHIHPASKNLVLEDFILGCYKLIQSMDTEGKVRL